MPRYWHDRHAANKIEDESHRELCRNIVADKKPYFMRYIYPSLMKQYNTYIKNTNRNALREFQMTIPELQSLNKEALTDRQRDFLHYYDYRMPVGVGNCVMNKICRRFEEEFDGYIGKHDFKSKFDYSIMKSDAEYTTTQYNAIKKVYEEFNKRLQSYAIFADYERMDKCDAFNAIYVMNEEFKKECLSICQNSQSLCNIILDLCYTRNSTKRFAWSMCAQEIIHNLLVKNDYYISFPTVDTCGDITYCGENFSVKSIKIDEVSE